MGFLNTSRLFYSSYSQHHAAVSSAADEASGRSAGWSAVLVDFSRWRVHRFSCVHLLFHLPTNKVTDDASQWWFSYPPSTALGFSLFLQFVGDLHRAGGNHCVYIVGYTAMNASVYQLAKLNYCHPNLEATYMRA